MVTINEPLQAVRRAQHAGAHAVESVEHPACRELVGMNAAMLELAEHLREIAAYSEFDGLVAELDAVIRELRR